MNLFYVIFISILAVQSSNGGDCGCRGDPRPCFRYMQRQLLKEDDEAACIENAAVGTSTILIFLLALKKYCGEIVDVVSTARTFEGRELHQVIITSKAGNDTPEETKPTILIDAGQEGGTESVGLALFFIQALVACEENSDMINRVRWVILPSTNPDGLEYGRFSRPYWTKNLQLSADNSSYGVDISRNFDHRWATCDTSNGFALDYSGPSKESETETQFITKALKDYKDSLKAYISIRRNGHSLLYPYASQPEPPDNNKAREIVTQVFSKVIKNLAGIQMFKNDSIYNMNRKPRCGHSVDYAFEEGIPSFEWRVFYSEDNMIMSKFQALPKGYEATLRNGYLYVLKEIFNVLIVQNKPAD